MKKKLVLLSLCFLSIKPYKDFIKLLENDLPSPQEQKKILESLWNNKNKKPNVTSNERSTFEEYLHGGDAAILPNEAFTKAKKSAKSDSKLESTAISMDLNELNLDSIEDWRKLNGILGLAIMTEEGSQEYLNFIKDNKDSVLIKNHIESLKNVDDFDILNASILDLIRIYKDDLDDFKLMKLLLSTEDQAVKDFACQNIDRSELDLDEQLFFVYSCN